MACSDLRRFGDRSTSDVVVRIRTQEGRDEWLYCHSHILTEKSKYFADRLSENWPTCQILDSRNCVEVHCTESDFDYNVSILRLLYDLMDGSVADMFHGVRNSLGILRVSVELGCEKIVTACVTYLESVPWEEAEEEEILKTIPGLGAQAVTILARLQPVNPATVVVIFLSAIRFATSSPPPIMNGLKTSAQEQIEYMLTEDDDSPLLTADAEIKSEMRKCVNRLLARFNSLLESLICESKESDIEPEKAQLLPSYLSDLVWACQVLAKLESMREFVTSWMEASDKILTVVERSSLREKIPEINIKVIEVAAKVLDAIGYGTVIFPTSRRIHMVKMWLPFVRITKPLIDSITSSDENALGYYKLDNEIWQSLEATFVSIILALPSMDQAEILTKWLGDKHIGYPDLTEVFEVWCYRSKVAKRRLTLLGNENPKANSP